LESGREVQESLQDQLEKSSPNFYLLCLAELDAGRQLLRPEYFASRATFVAQLRRLIAAPAQPSQPVPSLQAYADSQKWWLESMIRRMSKTVNPTLNRTAAGEPVPDSNGNVRRCRLVWRYADTRLWNTEV
jgi:hypothetical protein